MAAKYTEKIINLILSRYSAGDSISKICKDNGFDPSTVSKYLALNGVKLRPPSEYGDKDRISLLNKYSEETVNNILQQYDSGKSIYQISKDLGRDSQTIKKYLVESGRVLRPVRKHSFNEDFFENIDSEAKAYWLGFIYADGSVSKTSPRGKAETNRLSINISAKDIHLLHTFAAEIEAKTLKIVKYIPKKTYSENLMSRLDINSTKLCSDLKKHGVFRNKTGRLLFPTNLDKGLVRHFIRGFFDGNGSYSTSKTTVGNIGITANEKFLLGIQNVLITECNLNATKLYSYPKKTCDIKDLRYGGRLQLQRIYSYFYDGATIFLERKRSVFEKSIFN
jgi:predicted transcriptional regulator